MAAMELHQFVGLCHNETEAFGYLFQKKKELREFLSGLQGTGFLFQELREEQMHTVQDGP